MPYPDSHHVGTYDTALPTDDYERMRSVCLAHFNGVERQLARTDLSVNERTAFEVDAEKFAGILAIRRLPYGESRPRHIPADADWPAGRESSR